MSQSNQDIAKLFGLSATRFSRIFHTRVCLLSDVLRDLCRVPSREVTHATLPPCFAAFPSTRIVIDCTEICSQQASSLPARKQMFSSYKHHVTYNFLVGISPSLYTSTLWMGSGWTLAQLAGAIQERGVSVQDMSSGIQDFPWDSKSSKRNRTVATCEQHSPSPATQRHSAPYTVHRSPYTVPIRLSKQICTGLVGVHMGGGL